MPELSFKGKEFVYNHHLAGNDDTIYKQSVLRLMSDAFAVEHTPRVGELELVVEDGTTVECDLVLMPDWKTKLPTLLSQT